MGIRASETTEVEAIEVEVMEGKALGEACRAHSGTAMKVESIIVEEGAGGGPWGICRRAIKIETIKIAALGTGPGGRLWRIRKRGYRAIGADICRRCYIRGCAC